jgi:hypothetical protein
MAVLPVSRAMVWVGPPLLASGPRLSEVALFLLLDWVKPQEASSARLPPPSVTVPLQSWPPPPPARMLLVRVMLPYKAHRLPPLGPLLPLKVLFTIEAEPPTPAMAPPP